MQQSSEIDPEQTANQIMEKSFLKSRGMDIVMQEAKRDTGSEFFRDNKIRSCSFVKETENCLKAYPFYDKRNQTIYPTPSALRNSWTATVHSNTRHYHAGMGNNKTLVKYNFKESRNCMDIPDFRPPYPNSSKIEFGHRDMRDVKHYVTNYGNSFLHPKKVMPTNHPGIEAYRNKWLRSRQAR